MNQKWNAESYSDKFSFVFKYGYDVLNLIDAHEGARVIDLGCGTGILTNELYERGYNVTGIDASDDMLKKANESYPGIKFVHGDAVSFSVNEPVDVIFSNAVLHWIDRTKQVYMMKCVYNALKDGGQFVFEMGGYGNNKMIHHLLAEIFSRYGYDYVMPFFFPKIGEYSSMLENVGFTVKYALLFDRPTPLSGDNGLYDWMKMFIKNPFREVNSDDKEKILREAVNILREKLFYDGIWHSDYVRLRMRAVKD